jgi:hypothetical protein
VVDGRSPAGKLIFRNLGGDGWQAISGPGELLGDAIVPSDLDRDGRLDFVTDSRVVGSAELLNFGAEDGGWSTASLPDPHPRLRTTAVAIADFDSDGWPDLALAFRARGAETAWQGLDLLFGAPGRDWRRASVWGAPDRIDGAETTTLAAGDLDADGDADLVVLDAFGATRLSINDGHGGFTFDPTPETDPAPEHRFCAGYSAAIVDLDSDGTAEVVTAFAGEPGSESLVAAAKRCRAQGALRVWKVAR